MKRDKKEMSRKEKKFIKKYGKKHYRDYREMRLFKIACAYAERNSISNYMIYIVDQQRGDLKHPVSVSLLVNCEPTKISTGNPNQVTISWKTEKEPELPLS